MEIKELVESTNREIELLRNALCLLDDSTPKRTAIREPNGRVIGYTMNEAARKRISEAQMERWDRVRASKKADTSKQMETSPQEVETGNTAFAHKLKQLMQEKSCTYGKQDLAEDLHMSVEHSRRIVTGLQIPTLICVEAIASIFEADAGELIGLAKADKFNREYGTEVSGSVFNPQVAPFAAAWPMLTDSQRAMLLELVGKFVTENEPKTNANQ